MSEKTRASLVKVMRITSFFMVIGAMVGCTGPASLNGLALVADSYTQTVGTSKRLGYLAGGDAIAFEAGDVFSFAPIQLHHGKVIKSLRCVVKDNTDVGYIQANLKRGPINTTDPVVGSSSLIASVGTFPAQSATGFIELTSNANVALAKVDNNAYGYFLRVDFLDNTSPTSSGTTLSLRGCIVAYE